MDHFKGNSTYALPQYKHTKIFIIDIDQRSQKEGISTDDIVATLISDLGYPFYMEKSEETKGYHLYFKYKEYLTKKAKTFLREHYKSTYGYEIEPITGKSIIRVPLSFSYSSFAVEFKENGEYSKIRSIFDLTRVFSSAKEKTLPYIFKGKNVRGELPLRSSSNYVSDFENNKRYEYGNGTRIRNQIGIAFAVRRNNGLESDYINACELYNDGSSKDMALPLEKRDAYILKIFHWAGDTYRDNIIDTTNNNVESKKKKFIFDSSFSLPKNLSKELEEIIRFNLTQNSLCHPNHVEKKTQNVLSLFTRIYEKILYDKKRGRVYEDDNLTPLNNGGLFTQEMRKEVAEMLKIPQPDWIIKFLQQIHTLTLLKSKDGYSFSYKGKTRWGSHYSVSEKDIHTAYKIICKILKALTASYTSSYIELSSYKLYTKVLDQLEPEEVALWENLNMERGPPDGLEGQSLEERLKKLRFHVDKGVPFGYNTNIAHL